MLHHPADFWFKDKSCRMGNKRGYIEKICKLKTDKENKNQGQEGTEVTWETQMRMICQ